MMFGDQKGKKRIVIKIGSSSLTNNAGGLSHEKVEKYVEAIANLSNSGHEVVLVSSGAVAAGFNLLGYSVRPVNIEGKQAAAAVGQGLLIQSYNEEFYKYNLITAQILITRQNFSKREQYNNVYNTLNVLLKRGIIPIINENDTVSVEELTFGDNDMLSALVAGLVHADQLIMITDTDGLYNFDPRIDKNAKKLQHIEEITPAILAISTDNGSSLGTGGMRTKIEAAKTALSLGVHVYIGSYKGKHTLAEIISGQGTGSYFGHHHLNTVKTKKQWIAFHSKTEGAITIDNGAVLALINNGKSLLPAGVTKVNGNFTAGEVVEVTSFEGQLIGKGIVNFSAKELKKIQGYSTEYIKKIVQTDYQEVIHRDNWITLNEKREKGEY